MNPRDPYADEEQLPDAPAPGGTEETSAPATPDMGTEAVDLGQDQAVGGDSMLAGLGGGAPDSSMLSEQDLAGMVGAEADPTQASADQMIAALQDPNTPLEIKQQIEMQLTTAARRRMAGMMGGGA